LTFYSDTFPLPLPAGHRFPVEKYALLRERLQASDWRDQLQFCLAPAATDEQLLLVHTADYLSRLKLGRLSELEQRRIGFPWSRGMVQRSRRSTGATLAAARAALTAELGIHLAGGTHHAFPDHGQGFCVFNDVAVAMRVLQQEELIRRAVIIDLDVHQGNGTAAIFADDPRVFTFSMHGERNFPFAKCDGDLDIALPDNTGDREYLHALRWALDERLPLADADMAFLLAGADPYEHDRLGKLKLSKTGLAERDRLVARSCRRHQLPLTVVMAGGYAREIQDVVAINIATIAVAVDTLLASRTC
jgi:acetoin utilization deacetylase AcuC-like enzyme